MNQKAWVLTNNQLTLFCHVQPGSKQNKLAGLYDNCLKIQLKTPPVEGKANRALIIYLAKILNFPKSSFTIKRGLNSRRKTIIIRDVTNIPDEIGQLKKE